MSQPQPKSWIWWQRFGAHPARSVSSYSAFNVEPEEEGPLFVSSFDGIGPFERARLKESTPKKIGFSVK